LNNRVLILVVSLLASSVILSCSPSLTSVNAQSPYGIYIGEVVTQKELMQIQNGTVGLPIMMVGTINTLNGPYKTYFNNTLMDSGLAEGYFVYSNFTVPETPGGNYLLTLTDVTQNGNNSNVYSFPILAEYAARAILPSSPAQLQEGSIVTLNVTITGGQPSKTYGAEIMVELPVPLNTNYTKVLSLTTSPLGTAQVLISFPDSSFSPSGSSTLYSGIYTAYFNSSQGLGLNNFRVGFTDLTQYHRQDLVKISAIGYQPGQTASVSIEFENKVLNSEDITATSQGNILTTWSIPSNAVMGTYTVTISPKTGQSKALGDTQTFSVPGYPINLKALNLAGEPVPQILFEARDQATGNFYNGTTDATGVAIITLEKGNHTIDSYWYQTEVNSTEVSILGNTPYIISCQLVDLKVIVNDKNQVVIPFVNLNMTFQYTDRTGTRQSGWASGQTDLTGAYTFISYLPGIDYVVNASKYGEVFNTGNNTINNVPVRATYSTKILCPDETLKIQTYDNNQDPLPNVKVVLTEQASGIFYSVTTDNNGVVQTQVTFGQYRTRVYTNDNLLLNETTISVLRDTNSRIDCVNYNLQVSVKIVDYFGNPINNVNVQVERPGMPTQSANTQNDGVATFPKTLGGKLEITAYLPGNLNSFVTANLEVSSTEPVTITMGKYAAFGGSVIEVTSLIAIILIVIAIVLAAIFEIYQRTGFKILHKR
jgi:hypothetical protein